MVGWWEWWVVRPAYQFPILFVFAQIGYLARILALEFSALCLFCFGEF
jgi:hypothetical protein